MSERTRRRGSGSTRAERDRDRRDRFVARYTSGSLLQFAITTLLVNAFVAGVLGLLLDWPLAVNLFVLWTLIEFITRWWAVRSARRASPGVDTAERQA